MSPFLSKQKNAPEQPAEPVEKKEPKQRKDGLVRTRTYLTTDGRIFTDRIEARQEQKGITRKAALVDFLGEFCAMSIEEGNRSLFAGLLLDNRAALLKALK